MPRRIALLFEYPTLNGGERSMLQSLAAVDPREFEFVALAPASGRLAEALRAASIPHAPFEIRDPRGARLPREDACQRLVELTRELAPRLLHANSISMGRLTGAAATRLAIPCVAHLRDIIRLSRAAIDDLNRNRALIAVSQATRDFHVAQGLAAERTRVIFNGVDPQRFRPRPKTYALCDELEVPRASFLMLTIGQIGLRKGQDVLAAAAGAIAARVPRAQFIIVGQRHSSKAETIAYEARLTGEFARAGLGDRLHLLGYREDVPRLMNEADLLVHPAKQEPLGRVLLEAAASGLPIVATQVGGTEEILADGLSARLVPAGSAGNLAAAVSELASDEGLRQRLAAAARARVIRDFSPQANADRLADMWRLAIAQAPQ